MQKRCVALLSGGLDSVLAARLIIEQGVETHGFHAYQPWDTGVAEDVTATAECLGISLKSVLLDDEFIELIRHPKFGYGKNLNPCIDCKIMIIRKAVEYMREIGASFVVTGEVVGQRPMSQKRHTLDLIEECSGLKGYLLRPLCARFMEPTVPEEEGIVDREKLCAISGRSRKIQMELAKRFGIKEYRTPAGGCLLTDASFSARLADLLNDNEEKIDKKNFELLKTGRHFKVKTGTKIILGRDEAENNLMSDFAGFAQEVIVPEFSGPSSLIIGEYSEEIFSYAIGLICSYTAIRQYEQLDRLEFNTKRGLIAYSKKDINLDKIRNLRKLWKIG